MVASGSGVGRVSGVVAALLLVAGCGGGVAAPSTTAQSSPTTTTAAVDVVGFEWQLAEVADPGRMLAVVEGGPGLVAVGQRFGDGDWDAAVWVSVDGLVWTSVADVEGSLGGPGLQAMNAVTVGGPGLVAVGSDGSRRERGLDAAVWLSEDGIVWHRVPHDPEAFEGDRAVQMYGVGAGGPGLVAVGSDLRAPGFVGAIWTSVDGTTWHRVLDEDGHLGGPAYINDVVALGELLVAVGSEGPAGDSRAAVWVSHGGARWERVGGGDAFEGPDAPGMAAAAVAGGRVIGVGHTGHDEGSSAAVWFSDDGAGWTRAAPIDDAFTIPGSVVISDVASGPGGVVAVGSAYLGRRSPVILVSPDGLEWEGVPREALDEAMSIISAVTWFGGRIVVIGHFEAWIGRPPVP